MPLPDLTALEAAQIEKSEDEVPYRADRGVWGQRFIFPLPEGRSVWSR